MYEKHRHIVERLDNQIRETNDFEATYEMKRPIDFS
jgi:hypothetical protein